MTLIKGVKVQLSTLVKKLEEILCRLRHPRFTLLKCVGSKCSDKIASDNKTDLGNLHDEITNIQKDGLEDGTEPKGLGTISNSKTDVHQYGEMTLRSRKESKGNLTDGKTMFSRAAKQKELLADRRKMSTQTRPDITNAVRAVARHTHTRTQRL